MKRHLVFGITGASGAVYAEKVLIKLSRLNLSVIVIASKNGEKIFETETGKDLTSFVKSFKNMSIEREDNFYSPIASGGNTFDVIICPASMGFVGRVASGVSFNLLERSTDVALKERRKVLLAVRESPYNFIHLENMLRLAKAGATIMPLSPFFYLKPSSIEELVDSFADRILKMFLDDFEPSKKWGQENG